MVEAASAKFVVIVDETKVCIISMTFLLCPEIFSSTFHRSSMQNISIPYTDTFNLGAVGQWSWRQWIGNASGSCPILLEIQCRAIEDPPRGGRL
jgi:hypothetical protein